MIRGPSGVYWGELVGGPDGFTCTRTPGWEPATATVQVTRAHVVDWLLRHDPKRFDKLDDRRLGNAPAVAAALTEATPRRLVAQPTVPYRADLAVVEVGRPTWRLRDMFLVEARVVDAEKKPDLIELTLADVRRWWRDYGVLDLEVNLIQGVEGGVPFYVTRSLRSGGVPWKLREVLQVCLAQLPGRPVITEFPADLNRQCQPVRAQGASPLDVARQLAANAGLVFELSFDGTAAFCERGVGVIGECDGVTARNTKCHDPETGEGCWKNEVPQATNLFSRRLSIDAPDEVLVELPPPIWTVVVDYLEPVLPIERPDPLGGPPTVELLDITGDMLDALTVDDRTKLGDLIVGPDGLTSADLRAAILLRAPLLSEAWPESIAAVPDRLRDLLHDRNWRWWRLPFRMEERYAPILARAEVDSAGVRLPVLVEAWSWRAVKAIVQQEEPIDGLTEDTRDLVTKRLVVTNGDLERVRQRIKELEQVKAVDFQVAWAQIMAEIPEFRTIDAAWRLEAQIAGIDVDSKLGSAALFFLQGLSRADAAVEAAKRSAKLREILERLGRQCPRALAEVLQIPNAELLDPSLKELEALKRDETALAAQRASLIATLDPTKALLDQQFAAVLELQAVQKATGGGISQAILAKIADLGAKIAAARAAKQRRAQRPVEITQHFNLPRRPVEATWHPGRLVELAEPSGWLVNPCVSDPSETLILPLPPRVTFGSYNLPVGTAPPKPLPDGKVSEVAFVQAGIDALKASALEFARDLGHVVPKETSPGPLQLTFTRDDRKSGKAKVGPHPFRITREGPEWQVLHPLTKAEGDTTVRLPQEILDRASAIASDAMRDQVLASGSFLVFGARYVVGNGQISAVRWTGVAGQIDTTLYFDSSSEPVPGLQVDQATARPDPLIFGFELDAGEGA